MTNDRVSPSSLPDNELANAKLWLEQTRWAWERQRVSFDELGRLSVAFLSLDGVLLALLANAKPSVHGAARVFLLLAIVPALISAWFGLQAALPQQAIRLPVSGLREKWLHYNLGQVPDNLAADFTEMLLDSRGKSLNAQGEVDGEEGPVAGLRESTRIRGRLTRRSGMFTTGAILLVAIAVVLR